ncbi:MAG: hypothetical protein D6776_03780 [Planctomycetota bacterium]|nr:MAG: hypothetical protein D6776_03780 [Planctomycetota bacterium]
MSEGNRAAGAGADGAAPVWGEGRLRAHPAAKPPQEASRIELCDREVAWEYAVAIHAPSSWNRLEQAGQAWLHRVWRSAQPVPEPTWKHAFDWHVRLVPISETTADGRLDPGEYCDGWEFARLGPEARLQIHDLGRGEPSDETLLTHPERRFREELLVRWAEGIERVRVEITDGGGRWTATLRLPAELDPGFPRTAFCILRKPKDGGADGAPSAGAATAAA